MKINDLQIDIVFEGRDGDVLIGTTGGNTHVLVAPAIAGQRLFRDLMRQAGAVRKFDTRGRVTRARWTVTTEMVDPAAVQAAVAWAVAWDGVDRNAASMLVPEGTYGCFVVGHEIDGTYLVACPKKRQAPLKNLDAIFDEHKEVWHITEQHELELRAVLERATKAAAKVAEQPLMGTDKIKVTGTPAGYELSFAYDAELVKQVRELTGATWLADRKIWLVSPVGYKRLSELLEAQRRFEVDARAAWVAGAPAREAAAKAAIAATATREARIRAENGARQAERARRIEQRVRIATNALPSIGSAFRVLGVVVAESYGQAWTDSDNGRDYCYVYYRSATAQEIADFEVVEAEALARAALLPKTGVETLAAEWAPSVGATIRLRNKMAVVVTAVSRSRYLDPDRNDNSSCYSSHLWDRDVVDIEWREASPDEEAALALVEIQSADRRAVIAAAGALDMDIQRNGTIEDLGHVPAGEVLAESVQARLFGIADWLILADDGKLWSVHYRGGDGDAWGMYNLGQNTTGKYIVPTAEQIELLRNAALLREFRTYRRERSA